MSEQLLSKMRPKPTYAEDDEGVFYFIFQVNVTYKHNSSTIASM